MDQGSTRKCSAVHNFAPTVTKFCVMWEGQALPHDTKFGNSRCEIVGWRVIFIWSLIHGSSWSGLIKAEPGLSADWAASWLVEPLVALPHEPPAMVTSEGSVEWLGVTGAELTLHTSHIYLSPHSSSTMSLYLTWHNPPYSSWLSPSLWWKLWSCST